MRNPLSAPVARIALLAALAAAGCGESERAGNGGEQAIAPSSGEQNVGPASRVNEVAPAVAEAVEAAGGTMPVETVAAEDRSGPSRDARCRIDEEPVEACRFTPLFGDGSFNIALAGDREYRLIVDGERGHVFVVLGPNHRVPLTWAYSRDRADRACWVSEEPEHEPRRICAY